MPNWSTLKDVVLFAVALWGAALSTFNWLRARQKDRRNVKVTCETSFPVYGNQLGSAYLEVKAINAGSRSVTISYLTMETPGKKWLAHMSARSGILDTPLPAVLADGQTASAYFMQDEIEDALYDEGLREPVKVVPLAQDSR